MKGVLLKKKIGQNQMVNILNSEKKKKRKKKKHKPETIHGVTKLQTKAKKCGRLLN